jgi:hypothetical protein
MFNKTKLEKRNYKYININDNHNYAYNLIYFY